MMVGTQALQIMRPDSKWRTHSVRILLDTHDIAPDSKETSYYFTFNSVSLIPIDTMYAELEQTGGIEPFSLALQDQKKLLWSGPGGRKVLLP